MSYIFVSNTFKLKRNNWKYDRFKIDFIHFFKLFTRFQPFSTTSPNNFSALLRRKPRQKQPKLEIKSSKKFCWPNNCSPSWCPTSGWRLTSSPSSFPPSPTSLPSAASSQPRPFACAPFATTSSSSQKDWKTWKQTSIFHHH